MNNQIELTLIFDQFLRALRLLFLIALIVISFTVLPQRGNALNENDGEHIFMKNCAGCHINGGNIIRRNKTLRMKDLQRNGIDNTEAIAKIARDGIGIMSGYKELLGEKGDKIVANWILENSQKAWTQG